MAIRKPGFILKISPLSALDIDPTYQVAVEYSINQKWSIQQEAGYGNRHILSLYRNDNSRPDQLWRFRTEIRYYIIRSAKKTYTAGIYGALDFLYKRIDVRKDMTIGGDCDNGNCAYFQDLNYHAIREVGAIHLKMGKQWLVGKRLVFDIYSGVGWRMIYVKSPNLPDDASFPDRRQFMSPHVRPIEPGKYSYPSLSLGFKLGYLLYKKPKTIK